MSEREARQQLRECALALRRMCEGPLRGMFDQPTTAGERAWDAPAVALDLSAVGAGSTGSDLALGITMVCASAFLDAKRSERARSAHARGATAPKVVRTNDEAWRALPIAGLGEYYQASFKLSRATGVQHWIVLHRLSDLRAAGDEGTRQQRLAEGLLSDASTVVVYRQHPGRGGDHHRPARAVLDRGAGDRRARQRPGAVARRRPLLPRPARPLRPRMGAGGHRRRDARKARQAQATRKEPHKMRCGDQV